MRAAPLGVLGRENPIAVPGFVVVCRLEIERQPLDGGLLGRKDRQRRVGRDPLRIVVGGVHQLLRRDYLVQQPHLPGSLGVHHVGGQQQFHRQGVGDLAWQPHRAAAAGEEPAFGFHHRESRFGHRDANVGAAQHFKATGDTRTIHRGNDRLVDRETVQDGMDGVQGIPSLGFGKVAGEFGNEFLQIGVGAEIPPDAGDHGNPGAVVVTEVGPCVSQIAEMFHIQRVARLGPVDRNGGNVSVKRIIDAHGCSTVSVRRCYRH